VLFDNCDAGRKFVVRVVFVQISVAQIFIGRVRRVIPNG
jgi:hypothetical protein